MEYQIRIAVPAEPIQMQTARIRQPHGAGSLVQLFAGSVVPRPAEHTEGGIIKHLYKMRMSAADHKAQKRRFQFGMGQIIRRDVRTQMVYGHQRFSGGVGERFCVVDADQQRADQAGRVGHGNGVHLRKRHISVAQRLLHHA